jgi:hypothetical protein
MDITGNMQAIALPAPPIKVNSQALSPELMIHILQNRPDLREQKLMMNLTPFQMESILGWNGVYVTARIRG